MDTLTITDFTPDAVVIDAGSFPTNPLALRWLEATDKIVCCDGAANHYLKSHSKVWRIVGDCDSLSEHIARQYSDILRRFPDQETNDQTKAVKYLSSKGATQVAILGATGLREDHTIGNLSLLIDYLEMGIHARAYTDFGVFIPVKDDCCIECPEGTQISLFNFGATGLRAEGLRYPIRDFDRWWQGTLNEASSPRITIHARGSYLVFINYP